MSDALQLPVVDLSSPDRFSTANSIRQACVDHGFFYLVNHRVGEDLVKKVFEQSNKFFSLPIEDKMKLARKNYRGYTALYAEKLDTTYLSTKGDPKESFYIGPLSDDLNQWPLEEDMPSWRTTMETYHQKVLSAATKLLSLIALSLKLEEDFFVKVGALTEPMAYIRLLRYPGDLDPSSEEIYGASAHSDYGTVTLLMTDGVPGLQGQICATTGLGGCGKHEWVIINDGRLFKAFVVNIGDMMERWTNCLFRSTLHRVLRPRQDRYSVAFFTNPNKDCIVECLKSCCSESCLPRFPPIKCLDYLEERVRLTYGL